MIAKKIRVKSIHKSLTYVLAGRAVEVIGASQDIWDLLPPDYNSEACARALAELFEANRVLRPDVPSPFRHYSYSADPEDWMEPHWADFGDMIGARHGCQPGLHTWVFFRHLDRPHDHGHWLECRIGVDGSLLRDTFRDLGREQALCRRAEQTFGLRPLESSVPELPPPPAKRKRQRAPKRAEIEIAARQPTKKEIARSVLDSVWPTEGARLSYAEFCDRLSSAGVDIRLNRRGTSVGVSYSIAGQAWNASTLGDGYQWAGIEKHLIHDIDPRSAELAGRGAPVREAPGLSSEPFLNAPGRVKEPAPRPAQKPKPHLPTHLLTLLEGAHEQPRTIHRREERRQIREDFARVVQGGRTGKSPLGPGHRPRIQGIRPGP